MSGTAAKKAVLEFRRMVQETNPSGIHPTDRTVILCGLIRHLFPDTRLYERLLGQPENDEQACAAWEEEHKEGPVLGQKWELPQSPSRELVDWWNSRTGWIWEQMRTGDTDTCFKWEHLVWQELWMWEKLGEKVAPEDLDWMAQHRGFSPVQKDFLIEGLEVIGLWGRPANTSRKTAPFAGSPS